MTTDLTTIDKSAGALHHRQATDAAGMCKQIVVKTAMNLQGRKYVRVEGWQAIANAFGCVASAHSVERVSSGFRATGQVRRIADGIIVAEAEGFVGDDETKTWANRPEYARRAMAQTRAISRACRSAFGFVIVLMDAGLETVPAEEMDFVDPEPVRVRPKFRSSPPAAAAPAREIDAPVQPATEADMQRSRTAVNRAKDVGTLEQQQTTVEERLKAGHYTPAQADELLLLINGRIDFLSSVPEEANA
jgi:hypothetical protein